MAMNGNTLGDEIKTLIDGAADKTDRVDLFRRIGSAIVNHIKNNAAVTASGTDSNMDTVTVTGTVT